MEPSSGGGNGESKPSVSGTETQPEQIQDIHQGPSFTCGLCDKELTYKVAQELLSGLATACIDGTTGAIFQTPASVAAGCRKDMVNYLSVRTESFVAETVVLDSDPGAEVSDHPLDILSNMIDDYAVSRKSLISRVSGMMLSEAREDRIDEFAQEMERDSFWLLDKRESVAQDLIKNVDFKGLHHCTKKFGSEKEVLEHQEVCGYRAMMCENQGCNVMFSVDGLGHHDSVCAFKILPCEQNCSELLMRRDMDKHCITDCPMKLTNCPFYSIGCSSPVPHSLIKKHCSDYTHSHLINVLQYIHKEASTEDAERWAEQIEKSEFSDQLEARDVRTFTMVVKDIEKRIGPFEATKPATTEDARANPLSEQNTSTTGTDPPTDQSVAPPSKERELPSPKAPEQDVTTTTTTTTTDPPIDQLEAPSTERELSSLNEPEQDVTTTAATVTAADSPTDRSVAPPSTEGEFPSLNGPKQDTTPITTQNGIEPTSQNQERSLSPEHDTALPTSTTQTDIKATPLPKRASSPPQDSSTVDSYDEPSPLVDDEPPPEPSPIVDDAEPAPKEPILASP